MIVFALLSSTHSADYENTRLKILTERYEPLGYIAQLHNYFVVKNPF